MSGDEIAYVALALSPASSVQGAKEEPNPQRWRDALRQLLLQIGEQLDNRLIKAIAIDGTSSTLLLCDQNGTAVSPALMYNDNRARAQAARIRQLAPANSGAHGASSSLAKLMYLLEAYPAAAAAHACHQADWLQGWLSGEYGISDENNCLKLGYDLVQQCWPDWIEDCGVARTQLPKVVQPGQAIYRVLPERAREFNLSPDCLVIAGTTDSIAALIATGANQVGDAVTSLGSTLVLKMISTTPVYAAEFGIYSHRLGQHWLIGGASNSGGAALLNYFNQQQLDSMTAQLQPEQPTGLDYYPLAGVGERFPHNDPDKAPVLEPRPQNNVVFFQGMLEGIATIEAAGYAKLQTLGAAKLKRVYTTGGGSHNIPWRTIRQLKLNVPMLTPVHSEASYGTALLAKQGWEARG